MIAQSPHFGVAHALCLGLAPWMAAEIPHLVESGIITHKVRRTFFYQNHFATQMLIQASTFFPHCNRTKRERGGTLQCFASHSKPATINQQNNANNDCRLLARIENSISSKSTGLHKHVAPYQWLAPAGERAHRH